MRQAAASTSNRQTPVDRRTSGARNSAPAAALVESAPGAVNSRIVHARRQIVPTEGTMRENETNQPANGAAGTCPIHGDCARHRVPAVLWTRRMVFRRCGPC